MQSIKKCPFLFKSSKELTSVIRSGMNQISGSKMVNTVGVMADHGRDFNTLADHMTKLQNFTKGENRDFSAFQFALHLMLKKALTNVMVCLMISQKLHIQVAQTS